MRLFGVQALACLFGSKRQPNGSTPNALAANAMALAVTQIESRSFELWRCINYHCRSSIRGIIRSGEVSWISGDCSRPL
jgi:hypothetical protein